MLILIDHFAADHPWTRWLSERFLLEFRQLNLARTTHNITPFAPAAGSIAGAVICDDYLRRRASGGHRKRPAVPN
jgi:hypothetical protein